MSNKMESKVIVDRFEPESVFSFLWSGSQDAAPTPGISTHVEFTLAPNDGGTLLRLVESGFSTLDGSDADRQLEYDKHVGGWKAELGDLVEHLSAVGAR